MIEINSTRLGKIKVDGDKTITFPWGIPGIEDTKNFVLIHSDPNLPFHFLQSIDKGEISFILTNPFVFFPEYEIVLSKDVMNELNIESENDVGVYVIVSVMDSLENATANLMAPIVINLKNRKAKQVIYHDSKYSLKHHLFREMTGLSR